MSTLNRALYKGAIFFGIYEKIFILYNKTTAAIPESGFLSLDRSRGSNIV